MGGSGVFFFFFLFVENGFGFYVRDESEMLVIVSLVGSTTASGGWWEAGSVRVWFWFIAGRRRLRARRFFVWGGQTLVKDGLFSLLPVPFFSIFLFFTTFSSWNFLSQFFLFFFFSPFLLFTLALVLFSNLQQLFFSFLFLSIHLFLLFLFLNCLEVRLSKFKYV